MSNSFKEYILDILLMRSDPIAFKTAEFCKRNFNRVKTTLQHIMYEARKLKMGFIKMKHDIGFAVGFNRDRFHSKYNKVNIMERQKVRQVKQDVMKFIPFSVFILIPGLEILLPPFLVIFPNSVPSQFMSSEA